MDSNPANPANWSFDNGNPVYQGEDRWFEWYLDAQGHDASVERVQAWGSNVITPPYPLNWGNTPGLNGTGHPHTVWWTSSGKIRINFHWINPNATAPSSVVVKITSSSTANWGNSGSGAAANGLGSPSTTATGPFGGNVWSSGVQYRRVSLTGNDGYVELEKSANATGDYTVFAGAGGPPTVVLAEKIPEINPWVVPTYTNGYNDAPIPIQNLDITKKRMNVGIDETTGTVMGLMSVGLWGTWFIPHAIWAFVDVPGVTSEFQSVISRHFTNEELADIAESGPVVVNQTVTASDSDGTSRNATLEINLYAPQMFPTLPIVNTVHDAWQRVSAYVHRDPNATTKVEETIQYVKSVTKQVSIDVTTSGPAKIFDADSPLTIALKLQGQYGVTAGVTSIFTIGYNLNAGPDDRLFYIVKRNLWIEKRGSFIGYGPNGYEGIKDILYTGWVSATKEDAERVDREYDLKEDLIVP